jgi:hypothetical protein
MLRAAIAIVLVTGLNVSTDELNGNTYTRELADQSPRPTPPAIPAESERGIGNTYTQAAASRQLLGRHKRVIKVPRKKSLRRHPPLGCQQFAWPEGIKTLAIVGNGPLSSRDREDIEVISSLLPCSPCAVLRRASQNLQNAPSSKYAMERKDCGEPLVIESGERVVGG